MSFENRPLNGYDLKRIKRDECEIFEKSFLKRFEAARTIGKLDLSNNGLVRLPRGALVLQELIPSGVCAFETIPPNQLILNDNELEQLVESVQEEEAFTACFVELRTLSVLRNSLKSIPATFFSQLNLTIVHLAHNQLVNLPPLPETLIELNVSHNLLISLPTLPASLTLLDCRNNQIRALTPMKQLQNLCTLEAGENRLSELDNDIFSLPKLKRVTLSRNRLSINIDSAESHIVELFIDTNQLTRLPWLPSLVTLDVRENQIQQLDARIASLNHLERLCLQQNDVKHLPAELGLLSQLKTIWLDGNPLKNVPRRLFANGAPIQELMLLLRNRLPPPPSSSPKEAEQTCIVDDSRLDFTGKSDFNFPQIWPSNITTVVLSQCNIKSLENIVTKLPSTLVELTLSDNQISEIDPTHFQHLTRLMTLDVSNNSIRNFDPTLVTALPALKALLCSGNMDKRLMRQTDPLAHLRNRL